MSKSGIEQPEWIGAWAQRIRASGLAPCALLLVELARPFGFLASQALLLTRPLLTGVVDDTAMQQLATLLDRPELLEGLRTRLRG